MVKPDEGKKSGEDEAKFDWSNLEKILGDLFLPVDGWAVDGDVLAALNRLPEPHRQKKRATVLGLVAAKLAGNSEESVFGKEDTCSRNIWHGKWKRDEVISSVLATVLAAAETWRATDELRSLQAASRYLALGAPAAAARLVTMLAHADAAQARLAAVAILDRAGMETAAKSSSESSSRVELSSEQFALMLRQAEAEADAVERDVLANGWNPISGTLPAE